MMEDNFIWYFLSIWLIICLVLGLFRSWDTALLTIAMALLIGAVTRDEVAAIRTCSPIFHLGDDSWCEALQKC